LLKSVTVKNRGKEEQGEDKQVRKEHLESMERKKRKV
jgi:hypothetical protein